MKNILDGPGFNALVRARHGYLLYNRNDIYIGRAIEAYGEYSELEVVLFRQACGEGDIVVEVGANIGAHTVAFSRMVGAGGRVHAFEPQRVVFQTLCANLALNSITNVECHPVAVASEDSFVLIPDIAYDAMGNFGAVEVGNFEQGHKVPTVRLDAFLDLPRLKFMKVDVEGMECAVIEGARETLQRHKPILYVENDRLEKSRQLIELIGSCGYRLYWHVPPLFNPENFAGSGDNIYPGIASFNMLCVHRSSTLNIDGFDEITDPDAHPLREIRARNRPEAG